MLEQIDQARRPRQVQQHDRDIRQPPAGALNMAQAMPRLDADQPQIQPVAEHAQGREVVGVERSSHQQHIRHQISPAMRAPDPVGQGNRRADQPQPKQRIHTHFLAVAHRRGQQCQQETGQQRCTASGEQIHQPDAEPHRDDAGQGAEAADRKNAVAEQPDPAMQQQEIQRRVHVMGRMDPDVGH
ncbi:hypothetical protein D3C84_633290 [compost metagenome]